MNSIIFVWIFYASLAKILLSLSQFSALECFSAGDGLLWEDAWFYAASDFLFDLLALCVVIPCFPYKSLKLERCEKAGNLVK